METFMVKQTLEEFLSTENIKDDASKAFEEAAHFLMNNCLLQVGEEKYRLVELEFYYWSENHEDWYIHNHVKGGHPKQKEFGKWYVHASGLDLTFGKDGNAGGILLRGIKKINNDGKTCEPIYSGPINLRKPMLKNDEKNVMSSFEALDELDAFNNHIVSIVENVEPFNEDAICYTRVGLKEKANDTNAEMLNRHYRYIAEYMHNPECIHPFKEKEKVAKHLLLNTDKIKDEKKVLGYNLSRK
jgi:hypothetical protein